jgi:hypothetical protein
MRYFNPTLHAERRLQAGLFSSGVIPGDITLNFGGIHSETARCIAVVSELVATIISSDCGIPERGMIVHFASARTGVGVG